MVFNKMDLAHDDIIPVRGCDNVRFREMRTNIDVPLNKIRVESLGDYRRRRYFVPYDRGDISSYLCSQSEVKKWNIQMRELISK